MADVVDTDSRARARNRRGGPDEVLAAVFVERYESLVGLARLLLDERGLAEEVVQEAFVRTYAGWERLRDQAAPYPYLRRTVVNLARGGLRKRRSARNRRHRLQLVGDAPGADEGAVRNETRSAVAAALRTLPERQREVVVLRYFLECSTAETADTLGISEGAVKSHLHRALGALAGRLEALR